MTRARRELVSLDNTSYYHCTTRCVRRAFLCGMDAHSGRCFDHRKGWIACRIKHLASIFAIDIAAYAVMSDHYHVVMRIHCEAAEAWTDDEVIERWRKLFVGPPLVQRYRAGDKLTEIEQEVVNEIVGTWRERLMDISWFMRCLNEHIARQANAEDGCKGRFWESRFTSQALLDQTAILVCMAYVDLNPIRAKLADRPETSDYTSIQERLGISPEADANERVPTAKELALTQGPLMAFAGSENQEAPANTLPYNLVDYLELVDWTGRAIRSDKRGAIPADLPPLLARLRVEPAQWLKATTGMERHFFRAVGPVHALEQLCKNLKRRWLHGITACKALYAAPLPSG